MAFKFIHFSEKGKNRKTNSDFISVKEFDDGVLSVVCDGLGESEQNETAAQIAAKFISKSFSSSGESDFVKRIRASISEANDILYLRNSSLNKINRRSTTVDVLYIRGHNAYWGHIGDSRIYYLKDERLHRLTKDHSLVQKLLDKGFLSMKEASEHPNKNVLFSALGEVKKIEIDASKMQLTPYNNYRFFICTDGVSGTVADEELEKILNENNLSQSAEKISSLIKQRGEPDDYSFIILNH